MINEQEMDSYTVGARDTFSIRCESEGEINKVEFWYGSGYKHTEWGAPWYMRGDSKGWINRVPYLKECGEEKEVTVKGFIWSQNDECSGTKTLRLKADCEAGSAEVETSSPSDTPSSAPTTAPTSNPTSSPTEGPTTTAPTVAPTGTPTVSPTESPTSSPTEAPTSSPTTASPTTSPTVAPTGSPTSSPTSAQPPQPKNCYLSGNTLYYGRAMPVGTQIEVHLRSNNKWLTFQTVSSINKFIKVNKSVFNSRTFNMRFFKKEGEVASEWSYCTNHNSVWYTGGNHPPPASCYLWSNKFFYGTAIPLGTKIEVITTSNKQLEYYPSSSTAKHLYVKDHKAEFNRRNFSIRFVYAGGVETAWKKCKNFTPIAIDIDRSGEVEHITGSFQIDITGDGDINNLEEWFAPTEAIVIDTEHGIEDGIISGQHLFGDMGGTYSDGFEKLALHDTNNDGEVSGSELDGFALWIDANSNNILDEGELSTLEDYDIVSLVTSHDNFESEAILGDGSTLKMVDKWFVR